MELEPLLRVLDLGNDKTQIRRKLEENTIFLTPRNISQLFEYVISRFYEMVPTPVPEEHISYLNEIEGYINAGRAIIKNRTIPSLFERPQDRLQKHRYEVNIVYAFLVELIATTKQVDINNLTKQLQSLMIRHLAIGLSKFRQSNPGRGWPDSSIFLVTPSSSDYELLFTITLSQQHMRDVEEFLNYQLAKDEQNFFLFLDLCLTRYNMYVPPHQISIIRHWIKCRKEEQEKNKANESEYITLRIPKLKRDKDDKITQLSLEETELLLYYLQRDRVFLSKEFLPNTSLAEIGAVLTGYSVNTIRRNLSSKHKDKKLQARIIEVLRRLISTIENDMGNKKLGP